MVYAEYIAPLKSRDILELYLTFTFLLEIYYFVSQSAKV